MTRKIRSTFRRKNKNMVKFTEYTSRNGQIVIRNPGNGAGYLRAVKDGRQFKNETK